MSTVTLGGGMQVGAYTLVRQIGAGGMGAVWLAEHAMIGRRAAIKVLHEGFASRADTVTRFFNEARAMTAIADPGIVQVFDFGQTAAGQVYIVMEMLEGETLDARVTRQGPLAVGDALRVARQIASSLGAAHARGIVHRDLKPENVFVVRDGEAASGERTKLLDFGIAKLTGELSGTRTNTSAMMGTPVFMSPEQCRGAGQVDQRADVYSLGCVLYVLLTGRPPFWADGPGEIIAMHLREPAPTVSSAGRAMPAAVDALVARCLAKDPAARYAHGEELAQALGGVLALLSDAGARGTGTQLPVMASLAPMLARPTPTTLSAAAVELTAAPPSPSRRWPVFAGLAALAVGGLIAVGVLSGNGAERRSAAAPTSSNVSTTPSAVPEPPPPVTPSSDPVPVPAPVPAPVPVPVPLPPSSAPAPAPAHRRPSASASASASPLQKPPPSPIQKPHLQPQTFRVGSDGIPEDR